MTTQLVYSTERVFSFGNDQTPLQFCTGMTAIGLEKDGEVIAGVVYEGFNGVNIWMHVGALPGRRWCTRPAMAAWFGYPFLQCGVKRISGYVNASNLVARRFDEHVGFKQEAVLNGAAPDGGDVIIYAMRREECKYV